MVSPRMLSIAAMSCSIPACTRRPTGSMRVCVCSLPNASRSRNGRRCGCTMRRGGRRACRPVGRRADHAGRPRRLFNSCWSGRSRGHCGDRFVLRDTSAQRTIGGGVFLDLRAPDAQAAHAGADGAASPLTRSAIPSVRSRRCLECPPAFVDLTTFARDRALGADEVEQLGGKAWADAHCSPAWSDCVIARSMAGAQKRHARPARGFPPR